MTGPCLAKGQSESLKIDVCAGDDVEPIEANTKKLFLFSNEPDISILVYSPEYIFAEKLETLERFAQGNTRLKDFVDLWNLTKQPMQVEKVQTAILRCFKRRGKEFDLSSIEKILSDQEFVSFLEPLKDKKFKKLSIPPISDCFRDIRKFLSQTFTP